MAVKIETHTYRARGNKPIYDWATWSDGGNWMLRRHEDFEVSITSMRHIAYSWGARHGFRVVTEVDGDALFLRFTPVK
jgi:hypothetical protein